MPISFYLKQAVGLLGTGLFLISFQVKSNRKLFRIQCIAYICYTVHFLLLGALTGGISYILNMTRSFCLGSKNEFLNSKKMCAIICILQFLTVFLTWDGWFAILPAAANIAATIGCYSHNSRRIRSAAMFVNSPLWIVYDAIVGSWAGILDEVITEVSIIISLIRYGWKDLDKVDDN